MKSGLVACSLWLGALLTGNAHAQVFNLHLATDNQPDYTDMDSFVDSSTKAWQTPEEKSIAVWRWGRRSRHQLSCSREGAKYIMDPIIAGLALRRPLRVPARSHRLKFSYA